MEASMIGLDLAKTTFQAQGATADGSVTFRRKLSRGKVLAFLAGAVRAVGGPILTLDALVPDDAA